jgi:hypothetical protein
LKLINLFKLAYRNKFLYFICFYTKLDYLFWVYFLSINKSKIIILDSKFPKDQRLGDIYYFYLTLSIIKLVGSIIVVLLTILNVFKSGAICWSKMVYILIKNQIANTTF